uniref:hypothetical protein n=1 Tax=Cupriavidus taiwanensis TaxID=164546 RepID=UPI001F11D9EA
FLLLGAHLAGTPVTRRRAWMFCKVFRFQYGNSFNRCRARCRDGEGLLCGRRRTVLHGRGQGATLKKGGSHPAAAALQDWERK